MLKFFTNVVHNFEKKFKEQPSEGCLPSLLQPFIIHSFLLICFLPFILSFFLSPSVLLPPFSYSFPFFLIPYILPSLYVLHSILRPFISSLHTSYITPFPFFNSQTLPSFLPPSFPFFFPFLLSLFLSSSLPSFPSSFLPITLPSSLVPSFLDCLLPFLLSFFLLSFFSLPPSFLPYILF